MSTGSSQFLDEIVTAFDPVRGIEHGIVSATLSPASILTLGPRAGVETLAWLGFDPAISEADHAKITRLQAKYRHSAYPALSARSPPTPGVHRRPQLPRESDGLTVDGEPCFTEGRSYHLRPSWVRNREIAKVETVFDEQEDKEVSSSPPSIAATSRSQVVTDSGLRDVPRNRCGGRRSSSPPRSSFRTCRTSNHGARHASRNTAPPSPASPPFSSRFSGRRRTSRGEALRLPRLRARRRKDRHVCRMGARARLQARPRRLPTSVSSRTG